MREVKAIAAAGLAYLLVVGIGTAILVGCSAPCTYQGKAVPRADAERMRSLGMDVDCGDEKPTEPMTINGRQVQPARSGGTFVIPAEATTH